MIPSSVTDTGWIDSISPGGRPVLVIAEGLFMYLEEEEVRALILALKKSFPGCELVFDAYSTLTVKRVTKHPSLKKTGVTIKWGIDDATEIEKWAKGIRLVEEWYFTQAEEIEKLESLYRLAFRIAGLFTAAKKAHRILHFAL